MTKVRKHGAGRGRGRSMNLGRPSQSSQHSPVRRRRRRRVFATDEVSPRSSGRARKMTQRLCEFKKAKDRLKKKNKSLLEQRDENMSKYHSELDFPIQIKEERVDGDDDGDDGDDDHLALAEALRKQCKDIVRTLDKTIASRKQVFFLKDFKDLSGKMLVKLFSTSERRPDKLYHYSCMFAKNHCLRSFLNESDNLCRQAMQDHLEDHVATVMRKAERNPHFYVRKKWHPIRRQRPSSDLSEVEKLQEQLNQLQSPIKNNVSIDQWLDKVKTEPTDEDDLPPLLPRETTRLPSPPQHRHKQPSESPQQHKEKLTTKLRAKVVNGQKLWTSSETDELASSPLRFSMRDEFSSPERSSASARRQTRPVRSLHPRMQDDCSSNSDDEMSSDDDDSVSSNSDDSIATEKAFVEDLDSSDEVVDQLRSSHHPLDESPFDQLLGALSLTRNEASMSDGPFEFKSPTRQAQTDSRKRWRHLQEEKSRTEKSSVCENLQRNFMTQQPQVVVQDLAEIWKKSNSGQTTILAIKEELPDEPPLQNDFEEGLSPASALSVDVDRDRECSPARKRPWARSLMSSMKRKSYPAADSDPASSMLLASTRASDKHKSIGASWKQQQLQAKLSHVPSILQRKKPSSHLQDDSDDDVAKPPDILSDMENLYDTSDEEVNVVDLTSDEDDCLMIDDNSAGAGSGNDPLAALKIQSYGSLHSGYLVSNKSASGDAAAKSPNRKCPRSRKQALKIRDDDDEDKFLENFDPLVAALRGVNHDHDYFFKPRPIEEEMSRHEKLNQLKFDSGVTDLNGGGGEEQLIRCKVRPAPSKPMRPDPDGYVLIGPSSKKVEVASDPETKERAIRLLGELRNHKPREVMVCTEKTLGTGRSAFIVQDFYTCEICGKRFTAPNSLYGHYRGHAGIKPFKCDLCGKSFTRSHSLTYHMMIHNDSARFECDFCHRKFRHPTHYKEHLHRHTGEEPYRCTDCPRRFKTRNTFRRHMIAKHGKRVTTAAQHDRAIVLEPVTT